MLKKKFIRCLGIFIFMCIFLVCYDTQKIDAKYAGCDVKVANTELYDCGSSIYTYPESKSQSSKIEALFDNSVLYAGEKNGMHVFYVNGFKFYNVSYDDRSLENNNIWSVMSSRGMVFYDGSFKDSLLIDDGHSGYYMQNLYKDVYTIRQYRRNGELYRTIVLYNYHEGDLEFVSGIYNGNILSNDVNEVLNAEDDFKININSIYGVKIANVNINGEDVASSISDGSVIIDKEVINEKMIKGEVNTVNVIVKDYFGKKESYKYRLLLVNDSVLIEFSTIDSLIESSSRRIAINAKAGKGNTLDKDYCWYYWSQSPDDGLNYEEFLSNYALSEYKGSYSEDKGIILRNTSGTYYLYALAKDEDGVIVKRSEGYVLQGVGYRVNYNLYDMIFIVSVALFGAIPIVIYLFVRKKGY